MFVANVYRAQWKTFRHSWLDDEETPRHWVMPIRFACTYRLPILAAVLNFHQGIPRQSAGAIVTAAGAITIGLFVFFWQLSIWRQSYNRTKPRGYDADIWLLDGTTAHILAAITSGILAIPMLLVSMMLPTPEHAWWWITHTLQATALALTAHMFVTALYSLSDLSALYTQLNKANPILDGNNRTC